MVITEWLKKNHRKYHMKNYGRKSKLRSVNISGVIPKVCSTDHWWSVILAEVVRESHTNFVLRAPQKKFGNHWVSEGEEQK